MSERECYGDGAPEFRPGRSSRTGRRSGVILPSPGCSSPGRQDSETGPMETVKAGPRRTSIIKDSSVSKLGGGRKKTVSFSSTPSERKVSSVVDCLAFMQCGCELRKVRPNARVYCRFYTLDLEQACLRWEPSKKDAERARLDVAAIREVRAGKSTDTFRNHGPADQLAQEAAFSIIHGPDCRSLDLVALGRRRQHLGDGAPPPAVPPCRGGGGAGGGAEDGSLGSRMRCGWLAEEFGKVDEDGHGFVSEDVAVATICKLCPSIKEAKVRLRFKEIQQRKEKLTSHVTLEEFHEAYCELCTRPDVYFLLVQLSKSRECLDAQDLRLFLEVEQWAGKGAGHGAGPSAAEASQDILRRFEPSSVWQDMSLPLTRYYISAAAPSSFLQGAPGALEQVLRAGCRYLELGVSDGPEGEPLLDPSTAAVTLRSALEAVRDHAFLTTPFPLLIYLRQRCCPAQQHVIAQHLRQVFGDRLYKPEAPPTGESDVLLPSPQQLRGRVLLAGKKLPPWQEGEVGEVSNDEEEVRVVDKQAVDVAEGGEVGVAEAEEGVVKGKPRSSICAWSCQTWPPGSPGPAPRPLRPERGCGFSLRPAPSATAATPPQDLRVRVIGAHSLPKPQGSGTIGEVIDPYVVLELHGVPADCAEHRTRTAAQNQDDPLFDQTFHFQVSVPELALLRFVVLDDDYIGDDFIGQYSVGLQCLQCGYRTVPLLSFSGEPLPRASLFVHVTITSRQGGDGGGAQRKAGRGRILRHVGIRTLDHVLRPAAAPLKEAADLREGVKNAVEGFKEQCGLPPVAELKKCIQSLASRLQSADGAPGANLALRDGYPYLEAQGYLPESSYKLLTAYEKVVTALRLLIENADGVQGRIGQVHRHGVELQDDLPRLGEEEGLKGRILNKAVESFTWNLTVLKGQCDLLRIAKANALDTLRQLTLGCEACGLTSTAK
ncbi:hypothetical protein ANANG_G00276460 [Anguilla anguilla]|uniref:C2 domain-containing protein n=1 Tax=Anguilla anguilla TaxID=7936 RepID=A0A9D3RKB0_ANGAN|nr:hypothetical protein ANANG_G00276460 [Anguilla anguilla]